FSKLIVNHGSYGATPLEVLAKQNEWRQRMEAAPTLFMATQLPAAIRAAADAVANAIGARGQDLVFVDNATAAVNAALGPLTFAPGDERLTHAHTYGAVLRAVGHIIARSGARLASADLPFPETTEDGIVAAFANALTPRTRLVVLDHITSGSAL